MFSKLQHYFLSFEYVTYPIDNCFYSDSCLELRFENKACWRTTLLCPKRSSYQWSNQSSHNSETQPSNIDPAPICVLFEFKHI